MLGEMASEQPNGKQNNGGAEDPQVLPLLGRRTKPRNRKSDDKGRLESLCETERRADSVENRVQGVKNLLAEYAPQRRMPKYRIAADNHGMRDHYFEHRHRNCDRNENSEIAAGVEAKYLTPSCALGERLVD